jgi:hypothetical protein
MRRQSFSWIFESASFAACEIGHRSFFSSGRRRFRTAGCTFPNLLAEVQMHVLRIGTMRARVCVRELSDLRFPVPQDLARVVSDLVSKFSAISGEKVYLHAFCSFLLSWDFKALPE